MSHVRTPSRETATAAPGPGLDLPARFAGEPNGQDFSLRAGSQDNHSPFRFAKTDVRDRIDALTIANRASVLRRRELRRLFIAAVAWTLNALPRWNTRHERRRRLGELPDRLLRDIRTRPGN